MARSKGSEVLILSKSRMRGSAKRVWGICMYDVIVVGGASAGLSAAIYTSRQGMKTLVLTKDIGGQAILTPT